MRETYQLRAPAFLRRMVVVGFGIELVGLFVLFLESIFLAVQVALVIRVEGSVVLVLLFVIEIGRAAIGDR